MLGTGSKTYSQKKLVMLNGDESDGKIRNKNHLKPTHPSEVPGGEKEELEMMWAEKKSLEWLMK